MKARRVQAVDIQYLSERAIHRETRRPVEWVRAHTPLMSGCDYTPTGQRRVPRVCVQEFIKQHRPATCPACAGNTNAEAVDASASSAR